MVSSIGIKKGCTVLRAQNLFDMSELAALPIGDFSLTRREECDRKGPPES